MCFCDSAAAAVGDSLGSCACIWSFYRHTGSVLSSWCRSCFLVRRIFPVLKQIAACFSGSGSVVHVLILHHKLILVCQSGFGLDTGALGRGLSALRLRSLVLPVRCLRICSGAKHYLGSLVLVTGVRSSLPMIVAIGMFSYLTVATRRIKLLAPVVLCLRSFGDLATTCATVGVSSSTAGIGLTELLQGDSTCFHTDRFRRKLVPIRVANLLIVIILTSEKVLFGRCGRLNTGPPVLRYFHQGHLHVDRGLLPQAFDPLLETVVALMLIAQRVVIYVGAVYAVAILHDSGNCLGVLVAED